MSKLARGFTLVEILVVVAIIGILSTISLVSFDRYQATTRDAARSSKATILAGALEKYYDQNGEYPSCASLTNTASNVTTTVLPGVEQQTLVTPDASTGVTNSIECTDLVNATTQPDFFAYVGDSSSTCQTGNACLLYQLKYKSESTGQVITIDSKHQAQVGATTAPTLTATGTGFYQANATWSSVASATSYTLQVSTDAGFPTGSSTTPLTFTNAGSNNVASLTYGTMYYFRVQAVFSTGVGPWSDTKTATTWSLATPTVTRGAETSTTVAFSWPSVQYATSYNYQYRINGGTWSSVQTTTGTSATITSSNGAKIELQARSVASVGTSAWSGISTGYLIPATPTVSYGSVTNTTETFNWTSVTNVSHYDSQYRINGGSWSAIINEGTNTTRTHGPTTEGSLIEVQVRAVNADGGTGSWSTVVGTYLGVSTPNWNNWAHTDSFPYIYSWVYQTTGSSLCPSGTSIYSSFRDGVYGSFWNGWGAYGSNGGSSATLHYTSNIGDYSTTLQTQIQGYCKNESSGATSSVLTTSVSTYKHPTPAGAVLSGPASCVQAYDVRTMFDIVLTLQETSMNLNANTSVVTWTAYRRSSNNAWHTWNTTYAASHSATVNGTTVYSGTSASKRFYDAYSTWATEALYQTSTANVDSSDSGSINIAHNADGTKTISGSVSDSFGTNVFGSASCSLNYTLSDLR